MRLNSAVKVPQMMLSVSDHSLTLSEMRIESVYPAGLRPPVAILGLHEAFVLRVRNQVRQLRRAARGSFIG